MTATPSYTSSRITQLPTASPPAYPTSRPTARPITQAPSYTTSTALPITAQTRPTYSTAKPISTVSSYAAITSRVAPITAPVAGYSKSAAAPIVASTTTYQTPTRIEAVAPVVRARSYETPIQRQAAPVAVSYGASVARPVAQSAPSSYGSEARVAVRQRVSKVEFGYPY